MLFINFIFYLLFIYVINTNISGGSAPLNQVNFISVNYAGLRPVVGAPPPLKEMLIEH